MNIKTLPKIIQGGMGVWVSGWLLARAVSLLGQFGTVSGVALGTIMARLLQIGDHGGHIKRALESFPFQDVAERVFGAYFVKGGIPKNSPYKSVPVFNDKPSRLLIELTVLANYAFVWLAKEKHDNNVGINYLEKMAKRHVFALTGAMLAGVDRVTMGAGYVGQIPGVLDNLAAGKAASYRVPVVGAKDSYVMSFDPETFFGRKLPEMKRPGFYPIASSNLLAYRYVNKMPTGKGSIQGLVIALPQYTGGHNAPPRRPVLNEFGEVQPIYGEDDEVNWQQIADLGLPFWIAGAQASPEKLEEAIGLGAAGVQVGSLLGLSTGSGLLPEIRKKICRLAYEGKLRVRLDPRISPTGYPFRVACLPGTIAAADVYSARVRVCKHCALSEFYLKPDGTIGNRCPAEPVEDFVAKGGKIEDTVGRGCLCDGLTAAVGLGDPGEAPIVTLGDDLGFLKKLMKSPDDSYTAEQAINWLLGRTVNST